MEPLPTKFEINSMMMKFGVLVFILIAAIPVSIYFLGQNQDIRQRASTPSQNVTPPPRSSECADKHQADINCDGKIDTDDFNAWRDGFLGISQVARTGTIAVSPFEGTFSVGQTFNITLKVDGQETAFNAAQSTVNVSPNLSVQSVSQGDCGFAYVKTPTASNPSFAGVILGSSSKSCIVYTLNIRAQSAGTGTIKLTENKIKSFGNATEIFSSAKEGSYTITQ